MLRNEGFPHQMDPFKINQLKAMELANAAWSSVKSETFRNCWLHVGLVGHHGPELPAMKDLFCASDPENMDPESLPLCDERAELHEEVEDALHRLRIAPTDMVVYHDFNSPPEEDVVHGDLTDGGIHQYVRKCHLVKSESALEGTDIVESTAPSDNLSEPEPPNVKLLNTK